MIIKISTQKVSKDKRLYVETQIGKNHEEERKKIH